MSRYRVLIRQVTQFEVYVNAESHDDAIDKAHHKLDVGDDVGVDCFADDQEVIDVVKV